MTIWRMRDAYWKTKATHTRYMYFPLHQFLHERASMSHYTYIAGTIIIRDQQIFAAFLLIFCARSSL